MTLFSYIKNHLSILDVVQDFVALKKAGLYYKGQCPFHKERTASFTVSPHKEIYYCFGCHSGGDVISFISTIERCSQLEAAHFAIDRYKLNVPAELLERNKTNTTAHTDERKLYWAICKLVANWCHTNALKNPAVLSYLRSRNISESSTTQFTIGYFPSGAHALQPLLKKAADENILLTDLISANILAQGKQQHIYSPFEDRILFPIKDYMGNICGFGGRIFKKDDERPKYYNSREHTHFDKGSLLFGLDSAKKPISDSGSVFLVEGYTDCIAMVQHGYPNTVATLGTACSMTQVKVLARYAQTLYLVYDGDAAGQQAMLRLAQNCWHADMELMQIPLPQGMDPASYLNQFRTLDALLPQAQDIFSYYINSVTANFAGQPLQQKMKIARKLIGLIGELNDQLKQDILLQKAAKTLNMPFESVKNELARSREHPKLHAEPVFQEADEAVALVLEPQNNQPLKEIPELEKKLFSVIINNVDQLRDEEVAYLTAYLTEPLPNLLNLLLSCKRDNETTYFNDFFSRLTAQEKQLISQLTIEFHPYEHQHNLQHLFVQFQKNHWKKFVTDVKHKLESANQQNNTQEIATILARFQALKKKLLHKGLI
ncbi:MAG: DNA primase [Candidatus Babeliales bacterium]